MVGSKFSDFLSENLSYFFLDRIEPPTNYLNYKFFLFSDLILLFVVSVKNQKYKSAQQAATENLPRTWSYQLNSLKKSSEFWTNSQISENSSVFWKCVPIKIPCKKSSQFVKKLALSRNFQKSMQNFHSLFFPEKSDKFSFKFGVQLAGQNSVDSKFAWWFFTI